MNWSIQNKKGKLESIDGTEQEKASAAIACAKAGELVTCWCSDPVAVAKTLVAKGINAVVADSKVGPYVLINSRRTSASDDLAVLSQIS